MNWRKIECLIKNLVPGMLHFSAAFIMPPPVFTRVLLFMDANRAYILRNSASDFEAKATAVSSKEMGGAWVKGIGCSFGADECG